ncbi:CHAT domain-containing protein [Kitasatospora cinereorecta]|uniref:CHAT domain-containing protein n=1 Tax=Kitasatospora cinereorecta TaxID=285560 RepID=A0ABW0V6N2_9ACTN
MAMRPGDLPEPLRSLKQETDAAWNRGDAYRALALLRRIIEATDPEGPFRELWAASQQAIGDLLLQSSAGGEHGVRDAIGAYQASFCVYSREAFPDIFATVQNNLGNAYRELPTASLDEHEAALDRATEAYDAALTVRTREVDPYGWARTQNNLGNVHAERRRGDLAEYRRRAVVAFQAALEVHDIVRYPHDHAMDLTNLGLTYQEQSEGKRVEDLDRAMACFARAMIVFTSFESPRRFSRLSGSLGEAFIMRLTLTPSALHPDVLDALTPVIQVLVNAGHPPQVPTGTSGQEAEGSAGLPDPDLFVDYFHDYYSAMPLEVLLNRAMSSDESLLRRVEMLRVAKHRPDLMLPELRAKVLDRLGVSLLELAMPLHADTAEAIEALEAALEIHPKGKDPYAWGTISSHLAVAYGYRLSGDPAANIERVIKHGTAALDTRPKGSLEWGRLAALLGQSWRDRRLGDPQHNCDEALAYFEGALGVLTKENNPEDWARVRNSMARTLRQLRPRDEEALAREIIAYEEALTVLTRERHPYEWAGTTFNLCTALTRRTSGNRKRDLERSITGHNAALSVRTRERYPLDWAHSQSNLGQAYWARPTSDREGNLHTAANHFRAALEVLTLDDRPADHRSTAGALGEVEAERGRWLAAHEAFASAAAAGDRLLLSVVTGPHGFDHVVRQGHEVGELDAYALVKLGRLNEAVEALERGRTRWAVETLSTAAAGSVAVRDMISRIGRPVVYVLATNWGGLALAVRETGVLAWELPALTYNFLADLVQQTLPDGRSVGGYGMAQEGLPLNWLLNQWPGATIAEKVTQLHAACHAAGVDAALDVAAQEVLALPHPKLTELLHTPAEVLAPTALSKLQATLEHALLRAELPRTLAGLTEKLTEPLAAALLGRGARSITLIPCGVLPSLPITAAAVDTGVTLAERLEVTVAPSARALLEWPGSLTGKGVYTLGDPWPTHQELRWAEAEALTVAELAGARERARTHEAATRDWLTEGMSTGEVVFASCHGEFNGRDFLRSRLLLAGGEHLTLGELLEARGESTGLRALVMSACQAATMDIRGAHGEVRSLTAGTLLAGVRAVVAPLWAVDDRATYLLMVRFAQEWLPHLREMSPAIALARAQSWLRRVTQRELAAWVAHTGIAGAGQAPAAVRGRGIRYTTAEAEELTTGLARHHSHADPDDTPFSNPVFWAAFQVHGQ